jgi:hypothetical protein
MPPNFRSAATQPSDFTLTRSFDASRHLVFRIWTDAKFIELWLGVEGSTKRAKWISARQELGASTCVQPAASYTPMAASIWRSWRMSVWYVYTGVTPPNSPAWGGSPPGVGIQSWGAGEPRLPVVLQVQRLQE